MNVELKEKPMTIDYMSGYQRGLREASADTDRIQNRALAMGLFLGLPIGGLAVYVYQVLRAIL
jgi:hypothetical protein